MLAWTSDVKHLIEISSYVAIVSHASKSSSCMVSRQSDWFNGQSLRPIVTISAQIRLFSSL